MKQPVALVTGSGRGLGLSIAEALLEDGYAVVVVDNVAQRVPIAVASLRRKDRNVLGYPGDITSPDDVNRVIGEVERTWGPIGLLVNNAAVSSPEDSRAEETDFAYWKMQIDVNINGTFLMSQRVAQSMIKNQKGGAIVNVSSIYGMRSVDWRLYFTSGGERFDNAAYHVSKSAVDQLTRSLAVSWAEFNIRVNSVNPGPIDNEGTREALSPEVLEKIASRVPMRRLAQENEIAEAVVFLASRRASYITGVNLLVDGGWTSW